jgi:hypothetical protein
VLGETWVLVLADIGVYGFAGPVGLLSSTGFFVMNLNMWRIPHTIHALDGSTFSSSTQDAALRFFFSSGLVPDHTHLDTPFETSSFIHYPVEAGQILCIFTFHHCPKLHHRCKFYR